jgi:hypothetical protein
MDVAGEPGKCALQVVGFDERHSAQVTFVRRNVSGGGTLWKSALFPIRSEAGEVEFHKMFQVRFWAKPGEVYFIDNVEVVAIY